METIVLFLVAGACAAAPVAFLRLIFHASPEPWWFTPLVLLLMGVVIVFLGGVNLLAALAFPAVLGQILGVLVVAWGGWVLLGLRRG
jgi:hypothetical protein